jgi:hypothetical protein
MPDPIVPLPFDPATADLTDPANWPKLVEIGREITRRSARPQVWALMRAGWTWELPEGHDDAEPGSWYWRRPPRRPGRLGRLYPSTGQAYNAMVRERGA